MSAFASDYHTRQTPHTTNIPNNLHTLAALRVHIGILFSSVNSENKSSAAAINVASTVTVVEFTCFFGAGGFGAAAGAGAATDEVVVVAADPPGAGVALRLGSALTVRSFPCVSMMALGNSESFASSATGRRVRASLYTASTAGLDAVVRLKFHYAFRYMVHETRRTRTPNKDGDVPRTRRDHPA